MAWQIQCKQHFLKQLYTLNNQLENEKTLTWHEDVQMYCGDCMRVKGGVRGAMFCCWICMRVYESCIRFCESCWERLCDIRVVEELLRKVLWYESCVRCDNFLLLVKIFSEYRPESCVRCESFLLLVKIFSEYRPRPEKTWTWSSDNRHDQARRT